MLCTEKAVLQYMLGSGGKGVKTYPTGQQLSSVSINCHPK